MTYPHGERSPNIADACMRFVRMLRGHRLDADVTPVQLATLNVLAEDGPLTMGQLADRERVSPSTISRVIAGLYSLGLVARGPHPTDGRLIIVSINYAGRQIINAANTACHAWLQQQLDNLTEEEQDTLAEAAKILQRLHSEISTSRER